MDRLSLEDKIIGDIVEKNSKILDLGCGTGDLMHYLVKEKQVKAQGIEIAEDCIYKCVEKGLNVVHGDIEQGLLNYPDKSFDYVILNQSMQQLRNVKDTIEESLRIGRKVVVGFPNFAQYKSRCSLFFKGQAPITKTLPYKWYDTPNIHFLSINDFKDFCDDEKIMINKKYFLGKKHTISILPNLFASNAIFVLTRN